MEYYNSSKLAAWSLVLGFAMAAAVTSPAAAQSTPAEFVSAHNPPRADVSVGPVTWNLTVAAFAQTYANQRKADCKMLHSGGPYGENIYWSSASTWTASSAMTAWTSEKQWYNYDTNTCAAGKICGHYTQVVWRSSMVIGCAGVVCDLGRGVLVICNYNPPGNYVGQKPY